MKKYTPVLQATKIVETMHIAGARVHLTKGWKCQLSCGHGVFVAVGSRGDAPSRIICKACLKTAPATEGETMDWLGSPRPLTLIETQRRDAGRCMADRDGECHWSGCPQLKEHKSACPRGIPDDDPWLHKESRCRRRNPRLVHP